MIHPPQEPDIVPGLRILGVGIGVIVATAVGVLVAWGIGECRTRQLGLERTVEARERVEREINNIERSVFTEEAQGLDDHRRAESVLGSYTWVDRAKQIVRIPVERAYSIVIARQSKLPAPRGQQRKAAGQAPGGKPRGAGGQAPGGQPR